ncbi:aminotransferase class I/II-fold pyridoxal phosphate-dependent enzyme [Bacteroidetes/Chlorobi group bacterium ChocPot_Mid]|jgi:threonine aldolase|nr:MAG: aminotransferase class I/II-fold pyridoxal phosphate-dependent enzyme [Bacteroidetes/Chlorobi group bacterium ChocPot_Mid]
MIDFIDIRSDTVTVPTPEMRKVIANAKVGDDVFGEDPSVNELEEYVADLLGKEASLFVASGVMANQISLHILTKPADEVLVEGESHIFHYEAGAPALLSGIQLKRISTEKGIINESDIEKCIHPDNEHYPNVSLVCIENTHNRHGGTIIPIENIKKLAKVVKKNNLKFHCDGARLWEASAASGINLKDFAKPFDTVSVCLSKGLGAPIGSLVASTKENIKSARRFRKVMGGGMRQAGIIASAGLYAIKNHFPLLAETHKTAKLFAQKLNESEYINIDLSRVQTNIVIFKHSEKINSNFFENECSKNGVKLIQFGENTFRAVFHFQISKQKATKAADIIKSVIEKNVTK